MRRAGRSFSYFLLLLCLNAVPNPVEAQVFNPGGLFLNAGFSLYIKDEDKSAVLLPGLRGGGGWEFSIGPGNLMLGMETGFYFMKRDSGSPMPATVSLSAAYWYHLNNLISLGLGLSGGAFFAPSGNVNVAIPYIEPRLYGEWAFSRWKDGSRFISLYLSGGAGIGIEKENRLIMPLVEAGLRFRFGKPDSRSVPESGTQTNFDDEPGLYETEPEYEPLAEQTEPEYAPPAEREPVPEEELAMAEPQEPVPERNAPARKPDPPPKPKPQYPDMVIENEPVPLSSSRPITRPSTQRIPRGDRVLVLLPDGRRGFILEECTIYFGPDVTRIQTREETKLRRAVYLFNQFPASRFVVAGFSAWAGSEKDRDGISWERGRNVTDYLANNGIDTKRMELHWYGAAHPAAPNTTSMMAENRRVEIIVLEE